MPTKPENLPEETRIENAAAVLLNDANEFLREAAECGDLTLKNTKVLQAQAIIQCCRVFLHGESPSGKVIPVHMDDALILGGIHFYSEMRLMHASGKGRYDTPDIDGASYIIVVKQDGTGTSDRVFDALYKHGTCQNAVPDKPHVKGKTA